MPPLQRYLLIVVLAGLYVVAGKLGLHFFGLVHPNAAAVWPPTGVAIAALLLFGYRVWPAILLGAFVVNVTTAGTIATSLGVGAGNTLEALAAAYLVNRFANGRDAFAQPRDIFKFVGLAAMVSTAISASIGVSALMLGGYVPLAQAAAIWITWWLADAAGAILVTPLLLLWYADPSLHWNIERIGEALALLATVVLAGVVVFFEPVLASYPLAFLCLPPLMWAAFRFGQREVATALAVLALIATWATAAGHGPFVMRTPNESLLVLQAFLATVAMTALPIAALVAERAALLGRAENARADAERASRGKDEFLAMLSHELRNPLGALAAAVAVLERIGEVDSESARWRQTIRRQTQHMTRLIDDLLDISRMTAGKMALRRQPLDLAEAVENCVRALISSGALAAHRVELETQSAWVDADPDRINQIIANLLNNSIKYSLPDGNIRVRTFVADGEAVLSVEDSGIGIAPELLPRVFDLFTQARDGAKGGMGIGLTLVRRLVEHHGGHVVAQSPGMGQGSTFTVRLPRIETPAPVRRGGGYDMKRQRPYRILIVEDSADTREALRMILEITGHEVHEAADGQAGVEAALQLQPDVALVDIGLPHIDGYELARRVRATGTHIRLIAMTGYGRDEDKEHARQAGFDAHLLKPIDAEHLQVTMDRVLATAYATLPRAAS